VAIRRVLVLGATGTVGSQVRSELRQRGVAVRAASRDPATAQAQERSAGRRAVDWVLLDLERPATFRAALSGTDAVFMIARPGDEEPERTAGPFIEAMRAAGIERVVDLSALGAEKREDFGLRRVEVLLEASGLGWTHLRPNWFMQVFSTPPLLGAIRDAGELRLPTAAARLSFVDARDIAAVAAVALGEAGHEGSAYTLTGGRALDHAEVADEISRAAGRRVSYRAIDDDSARAALAGFGLPPSRIDRLLAFYRLVRAGACEPVSPAVPALLGRPAIPFAAFARDHAGVWRPRAGEPVPV